MKILFSHGSIVKLFPIEKGNPKNYENMRKFILQNLPKVLSTFVVKYKDEDGDLIAIESNRDIESIFEGKGTDYVRASIEDGDCKDKSSSESEDDDSSEDKNQEQDSRLHSDHSNDQREKSSVDESFDERYAEKRTILSNPKNVQKPFSSQSSSTLQKTAFAQKPAPAQEPSPLYKHAPQSKPTPIQNLLPLYKSVPIEKRVLIQEPQVVQEPETLHRPAIHQRLRDHEPAATLPKPADFQRSTILEKSKHQSQQMFVQPVHSVEEPQISRNIFCTEKPFGLSAQIRSQVIGVPPVVQTKTKQQPKQQIIFTQNKPLDIKPFHELGSIISEHIQPNPQQKSQRPSHAVSSSMLRSRLFQPGSDKNIARIVRTIFNNEFEQRLEGLIPKLMQKLKKQIRVEHPSLLQDADPEEAEEESVEQEPVIQRQKVIHEIACTGCTKQVIEGIRYKCVSCEDNFCEQCQKIIDHPHNLLKMRFLQVRESIPQKVIDPKIQFINKCFYLASYFGGDVRDFNRFVLQQGEKNEQELFEVYFDKNGKKLKQRMGEKLQEMTRKLAMYFETDSLDYVDLVINNPTETFEGLVGYVKECGIPNEDSDQEKSSSMSSSMRTSRKQYSKLMEDSSDNRRTQKFRAGDKKPNKTEQKQAFLFFVLTKYNLSAQKQPQKVKYIQDYFDKYQHRLSLDQIKGQFVEETENCKEEPL